MSSSPVHITVLLHEAIHALDLKPDGIYIDGTFGRGGHSRLILSQLGPHGRLVAFDRDPQAIEAGHLLAKEDPRFTLIHHNFSAFNEALDNLNIDLVDGVLLDLGVSSPQLDQAERGFSFRFDAPLDMRMDTSQGQTAAAWLATASEATITQVIKDYGEERFARKIAQKIIEVRTENPIETTAQLAKLVSQVVYQKDQAQHPATRTFQAIRIFINRELDEINSVLPQIAARLKSNARFVVLSFHSLEERIVNQFIARHQNPPPTPRHFPIPAKDLPAPRLLAVGKAQRASDAEIAANPRSRSVIMRIASRTNVTW
jgi:16S rRNA (cytosine1402-N4)-methyltransferase